ncbi:hypothetical protein ACJX0J_037902, partial [Zea mays]
FWRVNSLAPMFLLRTCHFPFWNSGIEYSCLFRKLSCFTMQFPILPLISNFKYLI